MKLGIELNRITGEDDKEKLSVVLNDLVGEYGLQDLLDTLPYTEDEYEFMTAQQGLNDLESSIDDEKLEQDALDNLDEILDEEKKVKLKFELSEKEYEDYWLKVVTEMAINTTQEEILVRL